ncbi:MAG TPA: hypothetical protein VLW49_06015 [Gaiellaceae bacterium]|nr:hypothetical protein [Gaiellaceae bacterium]
MTGSLLSTPRPVPERRAPALAGTGVVLLALPVVVLGGWSLTGWGIAAGLWLAFQAIGLLLGRLRLGIGSVGSAGVVGVGRIMRATGFVGVLFAVTVSSRDVGVTALVVYALAFTAEFVSSLLLYLGGETLG